MPRDDYSISIQDLRGFQGDSPRPGKAPGTDTPGSTGLAGEYLTLVGEWRLTIHLRGRSSGPGRAKAGQRHGYGGGSVQFPASIPLPLGFTGRQG